MPHGDSGVSITRADPRLGEVWSDDADQRGVWGEACQAKPRAVYYLGDRRANCTRGNGVQDTEDLDGDGNLDALERYLRFVVRLDGSSPFLVRKPGGDGDRVPALSDSDSGGRCHRGARTLL